ncbi:LysR family transcriptional regulator, partial [Methylosinus sp. Sm6]|nr:LysR family transcriptional regulator [Methylosinus sp. Sm6]
MLGVRQSAVSRRILTLENELGVSLFERHSNDVRLTWRQAVLRAREKRVSGYGQSICESCGRRAWRRRLIQGGRETDTMRHRAPWRGVAAALGRAEQRCARHGHRIGGESPSWGELVATTSR